MHYVQYAPQQPPAYSYAQTAAPALVLGGPPPQHGLTVVAAAAQTAAPALVPGGTSQCRDVSCAHAHYAHAHEATPPAAPPPARARGDAAGGASRAQAHHRDHRRTCARCARARFGDGVAVPQPRVPARGRGARLSWSTHKPVRIAQCSDDARRALPRTGSGGLRFPPRWERPQPSVGILLRLHIPPPPSPRGGARRRPARAHDKPRD